MARALWRIIGWVLLLVATMGMDPAHASEPIAWRDADPRGDRIHLYFFWSESCPHCLEARPVVHRLEERHPWLRLHEYEVTHDPRARARYREVAAAVGEEPRAVPGFAFCRTLIQGFPGPDALEERLLECRAEEATPSSRDAPSSVRLPGLGELDLNRWSLPATAVVLGGLDAFNPCAFFVLLFLLSLLVRTRSRRRMLVVASIFIACSGIWYFGFMAAWLNVFLWFGELRWMTVAAGIVAIVMATFNIKDFFAPQRGPSLSIPESAKPSLFARMRKLVHQSAWPSMVLGTIVLAGAANSYELLCTAGFPMVFTRILTLADLPTSTYYLYLALYNAVYVLPLVLIVVVFIKTLGSRKLQEHEGRALKLLSGLMMLGLGLALLIAPALVSQVGIAVGLLAAAGLLTWIATRWDRRRTRRAHRS